MMDFHKEDRLKNKPQPLLCDAVYLQGQALSSTKHHHKANREMYCYYKCGKGKAVPLQAWCGPEGSRKLRFPDYMTTAQDSGKVVSLTHRLPLPPENAPGTHFC